MIRRIAPPDTLGGGRVLDPHPRKHGPGREILARLELLARGEEEAPAGPRPERPVPQPAGNETPRLAPSPLAPTALELEARFRAAGLEPPLDAEVDRGDLAALRAAGRVVRVSRTLHYHADTLTDVRARVIALAQRHGGTITLAQLRDELGTSRKFAQAVLEHFDAEKLTIRRGDTHRLRGTR